MGDEFLLPIYNPFPLQISHAKGIYMWDISGKKYIDTFSGIGVLAFGHSDDDVKDAMKNKIDNYAHLSNYFLDPDAVEVAKAIVERTGQTGKVYFGNSGAEANEAALKAIKKRNGRIISFTGNFHGRTLGSLSLTGFEKLRNPFEPLVENVTFLPFGDVKSFEQVMKKDGSEISAVFLETLLGSGGLKTITKEFADLLMAMKEKYGFALVADEVQTGMGRTGRFYAYQHFENLKPDIVTLAKSIGGGLPLSATIFLEKNADVFKTGDHGSTFAPSPVALAASKVILSKLTDKFIEEVEGKGNYFRDRLGSIRSDKIKEVRGMGLMIGVELYVNGADVLKAGLKNDLLLNVVGGNTVRFLPALNVTFEEIDEIVDRFGKTLERID
ncbi:MAG: aspartate aminotransferase family protein [Thermotogae bacterium]|jgi:acetylornithine/N-succinyldiaminopimelate aminotransferase|nr:aspartate aminotransferase family protein [Thermotogota bacterium]